MSATNAMAVFFAAALLVGCDNSQTVQRAEGPEQQIRKEVETLVKGWVGAKNVSTFKAEKSLRADGSWLVKFTVDGQNKFGGPVREDVSCRAEAHAGSWMLVDMDFGKDELNRVSR